MNGVSIPASRLNRTWRVGDPWSIAEASELYEIARWGQGYFSIGESGNVHVHPTKEPDRFIDLKYLTENLVLRGIDVPVLIRFSDILRHRLKDIHDAFQAAIAQNGYQGRVRLRLPDQGQPAAAASSRRSSTTAGRSGSASRPAPSPSSSPSPRSRRTTRPIVCNGFKDAEFIEMAMLAQKMGRTVTPGRREVQRAGPDPRVLAEGRRPPHDRHAREAGVARQRQVAVVGRLPVEVRPHGVGNAEGARGAEGPRHAGLLQAPALPPGQPDPEHPHRQGGAQRGRAHLRRARQGRRRPRVPRHRRRPRRGLRRLADELRVERELHARGVRGRRRLPRADGVRRCGREAPDDRVGERARDRGVPQRAGVQRPRRLRVPRAGHQGRRRRTTSRSSRSSTCGRPTRTSRPATRSRATTTRSRRSTWR